MDYKCVIADLDGTLLHTDKSLSAVTKETIENLISSGMDFVPATGRSYNSIPDYVKSIKGLHYIISSNGVVIHDVPSGKAIDVEYVPESFVPELLGLLDELDRSGVCSREEVVIECFREGQAYIGAADYDNDDLCHGNTNRLNYVRATRKKVPDMRVFALEHRSTLECVNLTIRPELMSRVRPILEARFADLYFTDSETDLLEISSGNSGKHVGITKLCKILSINPEEIIAFGDNNNDIEMLRIAGLGVAMGNATEQCKAVANLVTLTNDEDGVAYILSR